MPESFVQATRFVLREGGSVRARLGGLRAAHVSAADDWRREFQPERDCEWVRTAGCRM